MLAQNTDYKLLNGAQAARASQLHTFHLVDQSPWPALMALSVCTTAMGFILSFHRYAHAPYILSIGFFSILYFMFVWWRDVSRESDAYHTSRVQTGLEYGMVLFIVSEAMFFIGFLWTFLHLASQPTISLGTQWPPEGIIPVDWTKRPLVNTALLFTSYFTANLSRYAVDSTFVPSNSAYSDKNAGVALHSFAGNKEEKNKESQSTGTNQHALYLFLTIALGVLFTYYQYLEYIDAPFTISDSAFGSIFFLSTGFHGFHVIVGTLYLVVCLFMTSSLSPLGKTTPSHHLSLKLAVLYWHFVDIVWIFLMVIVYYWGSATLA
jgi:cytochrome c oxidase subunit 3